jgi:hypothetical protein
MTERDENSEVVKPVDKIHPTHFPVIKIPLKETPFDDGKEWKETRPGRWKLVEKVSEKNSN